MLATKVVFAGQESNWKTATRSRYTLSEEKKLGKNDNFFWQIHASNCKFPQLKFVTIFFTRLVHSPDFFIPDQVSSPIFSKVNSHHNTVSYGQ